MENASLGNWSLDPSDEDLFTIKASIVGTYSLLCVVAFLGNIWVVSTVLLLFCDTRQQAYQPVPTGATQLSTRRNTKSRVNVGGNQRHLFLYILSLSFVDLAVASTIPFFITDLIHDHWIFGTFLCKLYYFVENFNKLLSINILVVLSLDRYLGLCCAGKWYGVRSMRGAATLIGMCIAVAACLDIPVILYTTVARVHHHAPPPLNSSKPIEMHEKCMEQMPDAVFQVFTVYLFLFSFCLPAFLLLFFYIRVISFIRKKVQTSMVESAIPVRRISCTILIVVVFYFITWTPFWLINIVSFLGLGIPGMASLSPLHFKVLQYFIHALPYVNSAANWVFYALLNRELRQSSWLSFGRGSADHNSLATFSPSAAARLLPPPADDDTPLQSPPPFVIANRGAHQAKDAHFASPQ